MRNDVERILISRHKIAERVAEVAREITHDFGAGKDEFGDPLGQITLIPILTGSMIFVADLIRHMPFRMKIRVLSVSSYPGAATTSQGVEFNPAQLPADLAGSSVLVIDDIFDTGHTLSAVVGAIRPLGPKVLKTCVLLKKDRSEASGPRPAVPVIGPDYVCFGIPDEFVVGYGLDFNDYYRNLPDVVTLRQEVITSAAKRRNA